MTHEEKELYAAMMVYYTFRGTVDWKVKVFPEYIASWKQLRGVKRGIQANIQQTVSILICPKDPNTHQNN